jgi:hypothetical protein
VYTIHYKDANPFPTEILPPVYEGLFIAIELPSESSPSSSPLSSPSSSPSSSYSSVLY